MRLSVIPLTMLATAMSITAAAAQDSPYVYSSPIPRTVAFKLYKQQMTSLRAEALAQQAAEGGTLSSDSKAKFQRRIDHIERVYRERLRDGFFAA